MERFLKNFLASKGLVESPSAAESTKSATSGGGSGSMGPPADRKKLAAADTRRQAKKKKQAGVTGLAQMGANTGALMLAMLRVF